jgi:hypothetical protein
MSLFLVPNCEALRGCFHLQQHRALGHLGADVVRLQIERSHNHRAQRGVNMSGDQV